MNYSTAENRKKFLDKFLPEIGERMEYLYCRWQDEKEYEDWIDYVVEMVKLSHQIPDARFRRASKRPFGFSITIPNFPYKVMFFANGREFGWREVQK